MIASRKGHLLETYEIDILEEPTKQESFPSINKAKQASSALQKSGVKVFKLKHKQTEKTIPSRQKSPFAKR